MIHRLGGGFGVVDVHARDAEARTELAAVDHGRASRRHRANQRRRFLRQAVAEDDQAVRLLAFEHERVAILALLVVLRVAQQDGVAFTLRGVFNSLKDQRKKWIRDVRDGHQQLAGAQRPEILGGGIRRIVEELDCLHHLAARVGRHDARLAQHPRHGGGRDPGVFRDLVDVGHGGRHHTGKTKLLLRLAGSARLCNRLHN